MAMEKFLVVGHFGGKSYADGGIALVRDSEKKPGEKEIIVVGPWSGPGDSGYTVENWPSHTYAGILKHGKRLELPDTIWDATMKLRDFEKTDSVKERQEIVGNFERIIGVKLKIEMRLAGVLGF